MAKESQNLLDALRALLVGRQTNTQEDLCVALKKQGFDINQSKVSRLLRKIGAVKVLDSLGQVVYSLPREPGPPSMNTPLSQLVVDVVANEVLVVIFISPGSASVVARVLDYHLDSFGILGTLAGDDTIFVAPKSVRETKKVAEKIKNLLMG